VVTVTAVDRGTGTPLKVQVNELPADVPERFLGPPPRVKSREPTTVYLSFDLSGSMSGTPLREAQRAAEEFVRQIDLTTTSVGLIAFSDTVHVELRASQNARAIGDAISGLTVGRTGYGNATHPFDSLRKLLTGVAGRRFGLVLADGVWSRQDLAVNRAHGCHDEGIEIIAIGFGQADKRFLDEIASSSQQAFFTSLGELTDAFSTIARELTETGSARLGRRT
jgi:molecular chaperone DnaK